MQRQAVIVTDIGYGDAGKGTMVDYLVRQAQSSLVIRHSGGPQAAHNVVTPDGRHHTFAQFGSGMLVPSSQTFLSSHMLINPINMFAEAEHLKALGVNDVWQRTFVDVDALLVLPWHRSANRLREIARGKNLHGSCGQGVGEARFDMLQHKAGLRVADLLQTARLESRLEELRDAKYEQLTTEIGDGYNTPDAREEWAKFKDPDLCSALVEWYRDWLDLVTVTDVLGLQILSHRQELLVLEGAQGVLLDEWHGFYPYNSWTQTTHWNALKLINMIGYTAPVTRLGVMRGYMTRHGAGPFVTQDFTTTCELEEAHNGYNYWQKSFRAGPLDLVAHRYALCACEGADGLAVTNLDRLQRPDQDDWYICNRYRYAGDAADAADYLEFDMAGLVRDIKSFPVGDWRNPLSRQAELLSQCEPVYETITASSDARMLLEAIETRLGLPVHVTSWGPEADQKSVRTDFLR